MKKIIYSRFPGETAADESTAIGLVAKAMWEERGRHLDPEAPFIRRVGDEIDCFCSEHALEQAVRFGDDKGWFAIILDATPEEQAEAARLRKEEAQAVALLRAAPEMLTILQQMTAAADLGEVDLEPEDAALLEAARAVIRRIEDAGRTA